MELTYRSGKERKSSNLRVGRRPFSSEKPLRWFRQSMTLSWGISSSFVRRSRGTVLRRPSPSNRCVTLARPAPNRTVRLNVGAMTAEGRRDGRQAVVRPTARSLKVCAQAAIRDTRLSGTPQGGVAAIDRRDSADKHLRNFRREEFRGRCRAGVDPGKPVHRLLVALDRTEQSLQLRGGGSRVASWQVNWYIALTRSSRAR